MTHDTRSAGWQKRRVLVFNRVVVFVVDKVEHLGTCSNTIESCVVRVEKDTEKFNIYASIVLIQIILIICIFQPEGMLRQDVFENFKTLKLEISMLPNFLTIVFTRQIFYALQ